MSYFNDLQFLGADIIPGCNVVLDASFPGTYSIEFLLAGRMSFGIDQQPPCILDRPALFWHHPRHSYQYGATDRQGWFHHWLMMRGERARRLIEDGFMPLADSGFLPVGNGEDIGLLFRSLVELVNHGLPRRQADAVLILERLLAIALLQAGNGGRHESAITALIARLEATPGNFYDFPRIAANLGISYSHLRRLFHNETGHAPHQFLTQCRLRLATQLLRDSHRRIDEVSRSAGFADPAGFARSFRLHYGMSPRAYRQTILLPFKSPHS